MSLVYMAVPVNQFFLEMSEERKKLGKDFHDVTVHRSISPFAHRKDSVQKATA